MGGLLAQGMGSAGREKGGTKEGMDLQQLKLTPPWEWPENVGRFLQNVVTDRTANLEDRLTAAEFAGDSTVVDDQVVAVLLGVTADPDTPQELREATAIALGPVLELADTQGFDDPDEVPITEATFHRIQKTLSDLYHDADVPTDVRRRVLEASIRAGQDWHKGAVRAAFQSGDPDWMLTAVFCMRYVVGFEAQIGQALDSPDPRIHLQAVLAAGESELSAAWGHVAGLARSESTDKELRLAAIEALAGIQPTKSARLLHELTTSDDPEISEAAFDALALSGEADDTDV